jgi:hypothetical protein
MDVGARAPRPFYRELVEIELVEAKGAEAGGSELHRPDGGSNGAGAEAAVMVYMLHTIQVSPAV